MTPRIASAAPAWRDGGALASRAGRTAVKATAFRWWQATAIVLAAMLLAAAPARAGIGFLPGAAGFDGSISNQDGSTDAQAGSHPYQITTNFSLQTTTDSSGKLHAEGGDLRDVQVNEPPGLLGNINAVPTCSEVEFFTTVILNPSCRDDTVIGVLDATIGSKGKLYVPIFNLQPSAGAVAEWGAMVQGFPIILRASLRSQSDYGVSISLSGISQALPVTGSTVTIWGVPADPSHDPLRGVKCLNFGTGGSNGSCPAGVVPKPYLTLPTSCAGPQSTSIAIDSWASPGLFATDSFLTHDNAGNPVGFEGCSRLLLTPTMSVAATTGLAEAPSGLDFGLDIADEGLTEANGLAQSQVNRTVLTLPEGFTLNPSAAVGLGVCTPSDYHRETATSAPGEGCPAASRIGGVTVESPLLQQALQGSLFLAQPDDPATSTPGAENPFDALLAVYLVVKAPERGIVVKLPGKVDANPQTGQLTATFPDLPQLPFSHVRVQLREDQAAPLSTPPACGTFTAGASLVPWAAADIANPAPAEAVGLSSPLAVTSGSAGGPCLDGAQPPLKPRVVAGTLSNAAASYSPFYMRIARENGEQELTRFSTTLPPGLTGNLTGIPFCPEADIEAARHAGGREELNDPSCPAASEIGHTLVGSGVGSPLAQTPGELYLAGPYRGAPLSIVSITSASVGPFDLGTVVIRFGLSINPLTAQAEVDAEGSDQIPHIIDGIVTHVRDIRVYVDRPRFILNPTSCAPMRISNVVSGAGANVASAADDAQATLTNRFQAADCARLTFKPTFRAQTSGRTSRRRGASLTVTLAYPKAPQGTQANIRSVSVELPKRLPSRLSTLKDACPQGTFAVNPAACPAGSRVGAARALTPVVPVPLQGPAYFVSHGGAQFPELIVVLQGYGIRIDLHGQTFISKAGITSSVFRNVPDEPVTSFRLSLPQGPHSALAAHGNLCAAVRAHRPTALEMPTTFIAQNGLAIRRKTPIAVTGCPRRRAHPAR